MHVIAAGNLETERILVSVLIKRVEFGLMTRLTTIL
jgi:hypothetical protein